MIILYLYPYFPLILSPYSISNPPSSSSKQPHVRKDEPHGQEEAEPDLPAHARLLGHAQHAGHGAAEPDARVVEGVVHAVGEGGGGADLVADGDGYLGGRLRRLDLGILVGGGGIRGRGRGEGKSEHLSAS